MVSAQMQPNGNPLPKPGEQLCLFPGMNGGTNKYCGIRKQNVLVEAFCPGEKVVAQLLTLSKVVCDTARKTTLRERLDTMVSGVPSAFGVERVRLYFIEGEPGTRVFRPVASFGIELGEVKPIPEPKQGEEKWIVWYMPEKHEPMNIRDIHNDPKITPFAAQKAEEFIGSRAFGVVPLIFEGNVTGIIIVDDPQSKREISDETIYSPYLGPGGFAEHAAIQIDNARTRAALSQERDNWRKVARTFAHEIRNPTVSLGGFAQSLLKSLGDGKIDPEFATLALRIITKEAARIEKTLDTIITTALSHAGALVPTKADVSTKDIESETNEVFSGRVPKGLGFTVSLEEAVISIDRALFIDMALGNLISNAFKYTKEGEVRIEGRKVAGGYEISISDTGTGIPKAEQELIFQPFYRAEAHRANGDGFGMGLPLVKDIVERHGGTISVESEPGKGTCFKIFLPAEPAQ